MSGESRADAYLGDARRVLAGEYPARGAWARAVALTTRGGLEAALDAYWSSSGVAAVGRLSRRAQLTCLASYADRDTADRVRGLWNELSRACHHQAYELAPTVGELRTWIERTEGVSQELAGR